MHIYCKGEGKGTATFEHFCMPAWFVNATLTLYNCHLAEEISISAPDDVLLSLLLWTFWGADNLIENFKHKLGFLFQ